APAASSPLSLHDALPISTWRIATRGLGTWAANVAGQVVVVTVALGLAVRPPLAAVPLILLVAVLATAAFALIARALVSLWPRARSEEHTSELQSRFDLVC